MDHQKHTPVVTPEEDAHTLQFQSRRSASDILGSYTGTDGDGEAPEQDVDDL